LDFFFKADDRRRRWRRQRGRRFVYQLKLTEQQKRRRSMNVRFVSLRLVKLYYITYSYRQFRALARTMRRRRGAFEENFLLALESRLAPLLYRLTFIGNPFHCLDFIRRGFVFVEGRGQRKPNTVFGLHQLLTLSGLGRRWVYHELQLRLATGRLLFNVPRYLKVSFFFLYAYQIRPPRRQDLVFPIALDFYRATGYAF
jgi:ribosomal protein S4